MAGNILIGGAAGQGMETLAAVLEKLLQRSGFEIFTIRDYMSRIRGGHNFIQVRYAGKRIYSHAAKLDGIIALDGQTVHLHQHRLRPGGVIICDLQDQGDLVKSDQLLAVPLRETAKTAGNIKAFGSAALGAICQYFGLEFMKTDEVFSEIFGQGEIAGQNLAAFQAGRKLVAEKSPWRSVKPGAAGKMLLNGNQAIALGAIAAGVRFYSAYPMTPSTSIMNYLAARMAETGIVVEQAEDEIAAINMAIGASYAGVRSMTGTSGGGFSLMVEALGLSAMMEVPLVVAEIQRPGPTTGFPTRTEQGDLRFVISAGQGEFPRLVIALKSPDDAFRQTVRAFNLADRYRIPVILLGDQFLADYTTTVMPFDVAAVSIDRYLDTQRFSSGNGREYQTYEINPSGLSPRLIPGQIPEAYVRADSDEHDENGYITEAAEIRVIMQDKRLGKMIRLAGEMEEPDFIGDDDFTTLFLAWGSLYGPLREAVKTLNGRGIKAGALIFGDIWPLPKKLLLAKAEQAIRLINVEQNGTGQLASLICQETGIVCGGRILKYDGRPLSAEEIVASFIKLQSRGEEE